MKQVYANVRATNVDGEALRELRLILRIVGAEQRENVARADTWHKWKLSAGKRASPVYTTIIGSSCRYVRLFSAFAQFSLESCPRLLSPRANGLIFDFVDLVHAAAAREIITYP